MRFLTVLGLLALAGCQSTIKTVPTPPSPVVATRSILPMPIMPVSEVRGQAVHPPVTNIVGTNVIVCGSYKGKPWCVTNPIPALPRTAITLSWIETNYTAGHGWLSNSIVYSTNGIAGPWKLFCFVPVTNMNMAANISINPALASALFRVGTLSQ